MATVCVFGAGAIGGHLAARLAVAGHRVDVVARGAHLGAIRAHGLRLRFDGREVRAAVHATDQSDTLGTADVTLVTVKSTALRDAAASLKTLARRTSAMAFVTNGIPWWYGWHRATPLPERTRALLDAGGLAEAIPPEIVVGVVAYAPSSVIEPGVIHCAPSTSRFVMGPAAPSGDAATNATAALLREADIAVELAPDVRREVWRKLALNAAMSPVCTLTGGGNRAVTADIELRGLCRDLLAEVAAVAAREGFPAPADEGQIDPARLPPHKPSMLQDLEAGRPLETDSILRAVQCLARDGDVDTPLLDVVTALVEMRAQCR